MPFHSGTNSTAARGRGRGDDLAEIAPTRQVAQTQL